MVLAIIVTAVIWVFFAFFHDRTPSGDYFPNFIPLLQFLMAVIVTLVIWMIYFALT